tara:strand:- start:74 stop:412 length:339 start_codon:yes stop_codon:yes gene_type:complete
LDREKKQKLRKLLQERTEGKPIKIAQAQKIGKFFKVANDLDNIYGPQEEIDSLTGFPVVIDEPKKPVVIEPKKKVEPKKTVVVEPKKTVVVEPKKPVVVRVAKGPEKRTFKS